MQERLEVRVFRSGDESRLREIFYNTIRNVNRRDYSQRQVEAWAPDTFDAERWGDRMRALRPFVCTLGGEMVGYADVQETGYIDHFYVDHRKQGLGIGTALYSRIEREARDQGMETLWADVSKTARAFFESKGFVVEASQVVQVSGVSMTNYRMRKRLS